MNCCRAFRNIYKYKEKSNKNQQNSSGVTNHIDVSCSMHCSCLDFGWQTRSPALLLTEDLEILSNKNGKWYGGGVVQTRSFCIDWVHLFLFYFFIFFCEHLFVVCRCTNPQEIKWIENLGMEQGYLHCLVLSCFLSLSWISHPRNHALLTKTKFHQSMKSIELRKVKCVGRPIRTSAKLYAFPITRLVG
jgi:hypothetical protein